MPEVIPSGRRDLRYRAHLPIRYDRGEQLAASFADNVSRGGLFLRGAEHLTAGERIDFELELPGGFVFDVTARVAYILSRDEAARCGRQPGAGLAILDSPPGFEDVLGDFLHQLDLDL